MLIKQLLTALFYGVASLFIVFANKIVLTSYAFPSFQILALGQLVVTLVGFHIANFTKYVKLPEINLNTTKKIMPLPILFFGNLLFGLGGTKSISLPMFSVLRRFSVLMTMYGEFYFLRTTKSFPIQLTVYLMVLGALVAAYDDLAFDLYGYIYVMLNNIFSAFNGIFTKEKLDHSNLGENGLLYYNALFTIFPMFFLSVYTGEIGKLDDFEHWLSPGFWFFFILSSLMGFLLNYSTMLCTRHNSPLTTTVIGCLKNILVTFVGIFIGGDYIFSLLNFSGLSISAFASVVYSYLTFKTPKKKTNNINNVSTTSNAQDLNDSETDKLLDKNDFDKSKENIEIKIANKIESKNNDINTEEKLNLIENELKGSFNSYYNKHNYNGFVANNNLYNNTSSNSNGYNYNYFKSKNIKKGNDLNIV